jgi:hypothetical protein
MMSTSTSMNEDEQKTWKMQDEIPELSQLHSSLTKFSDSKQKIPVDKIQNYFKLISRLSQL